MRYTANVAREELTTVNRNLKLVDPNEYLVIQGRSGYYGLDLYSKIGGSDPQDRAKDRCVRTLTCGTPRACIDAARGFLLGRLVSELYKLKGEDEIP